MPDRQHSVRLKDGSYEVEIETTIGIDLDSLIATAHTALKDLKSG